MTQATAGLQTWPSDAESRNRGLGYLSGWRALQWHTLPGVSFAPVDSSGDIANIVVPLAQWTPTVSKLRSPKAKPVSYLNDAAFGRSEDFAQKGLIVRIRG